MATLESVDAWKSECDLESTLEAAIEMPPEGGGAVPAAEGATLAELALGRAVGAGLGLFPAPVVGGLLGGVVWRLKESLLRRRGRSDATDVARAAWAPGNASAINPRGDLVDRLGSDLCRRFAKAAESEEELLSREPGDCSDLVLVQAVRVEATLKSILLSASDGLNNVVLNRLKSHHRLILERQLAGEGRPTLGSLHLFSIGLKRAVRAGDAEALEWAERRFVPTVSRYISEQESVLACLGQKDLPRFVDTVREKYRNPLAHGMEMKPLGADDYREWCDLVYASASLRQWLQSGTDSALHKPKHIGWVSFLAAGLAVAGPLPA